MVLMRPIALDDQFVYMIDYMIFVFFSNRPLTGFFRKSIQEQVQVVELLVKQVEEFHVEEQIVVKYVEEVHVEEQAVVLLVEQVEEV